MNDREAATIHEFLLKVPLLATLQNLEIKDLVSKAQIYKFEKDSYIFKKNTLAHTLFIIMVGTVEEIVSDNNEFTVTVKLRHKCDYMGELGVMLGEPYPSSAKAQTDVEAIGIPQDVFRRLAFRNEKVMKFILKTLSERLQNCAKMTLSFLMFNSEGRAAYRILMMLHDQEDNANKIELTQEDLSHICAVTRQTISIILNGWKKEGIIEIKRGYLEVVDKEKLVDIFLENTICR